MTGPLSSGENPFGSRTMFKRAGSVEISSRLYRSTRWSMEQSVKWIEEFAERARAVMFDLSLARRGGWAVSAYADLLQSAQPEDMNPGFISRFRGNDRFGVKVRATF